MNCLFKSLIYALVFIFSLNPLLAINNEKTLILTGENLTIEDVVRLSREHLRIQIDPQALERVKLSHELLLQAAKENHPIYGLNRGVGLNKDKTIFKGNVIDPEAQHASEIFNKNILYSHSAAVEPELSRKIVFPVMLIRLNMMLQGKSGVHPKVIEMLTAFINHRIQPVVPGRGSMGEGDITILSHIGLAMIGEGEVIYEGKRILAKEALALCHLEPLIPYGKDALSILSSNAYSAAMGALIIYDTEEFLNKADYIFALSLEGLNGNIAPFLSEVQMIRPFKGQMESATNIRKALTNSSLWKRSETRELQDPLSFRSASQVHGTIRDILSILKEKIHLQINSSDDNPAVILDITSNQDESEQVNAYYVREKNGAIIPTANFEPINWVIDFESLAIALTHVSHLSTQRMIKLADERFTKLNRFLAPNNETIAFGTIQKTFVSLDTEIRALSMPLSEDFFPVAGDIEDHATNAPIILHRVCKILTNLHYIFGIEMMHASQAVDLRQKKDPHFQLGCFTKALYQAYRKEIVFLMEDRPLFDDIRRSYEFVGSSWLVELQSLDRLPISK